MQMNSSFLPLCMKKLPTKNKTFCGNLTLINNKTNDALLVLDDFDSFLYPIDKDGGTKPSLLSM